MKFALYPRSRRVSTAMLPAPSSAGTVPTTARRSASIAVTVPSAVLPAYTRRSPGWWPSPAG
ncbi:hypothetical protein ACFQ1B_34060 [Streptomyces mexicanus]